MQTIIPFAIEPKVGKIKSTLLPNYYYNTLSQDIFELEFMQKKLDFLAEKWETEADKDLFSEAQDKAFEEFSEYNRECFRFAKRIVKELRDERILAFIDSIC